MEDMLLQRRLCLGCLLYRELAHGAKIGRLCCYQHDVRVNEHSQSDQHGDIIHRHNIDQ